MTTHKGRDAVASSSLQSVVLEELFNYFVMHLCIPSLFWRNYTFENDETMPLLSCHHLPAQSHYGCHKGAHCECP